MDDAGFLAGLLSGLAVWAVSGLVLALVAVVRQRRARRREIISLVNRAHALMFSAMGERLFDEAWIANSDRPLREVKAQYDDLTAQALNLFEPAESDVAFWCAVELYAGWRSPLHEIEKAGVPREANEDGTRVVDPGSMWQPWILPRAKSLAEWAKVTWPWDYGSRRGPAYGTLGSPGDRARHELVPPNSDVNGDMLTAYANLLTPPDWEPSPRRARELRTLFPPAVET